jgi:PAS domain-containing protein
MAANNLRSLRGKKQLQKPLDAPKLSAPIRENSDSLSPVSSTGLVDAGMILEVIPYPVALWSLDRRSCIFNHPTRELLGFAEDDFRQNNSLWTERIVPQDRPAFVSAWRKLQAAEKKVSCNYRFLPRNRTLAVRLREISTFYPGRESDSLAVWSLYTEDAGLDDALTETYPLR